MVPRGKEKMDIGPGRFAPLGLVGNLNEGILGSGSTYSSGTILLPSATGSCGASSSVGIGLPEAIPSSNSVVGVSPSAPSLVATSSLSGKVDHVPLPTPMLISVDTS
jgi:hypothetical protein